MRARRGGGAAAWVVGVLAAPGTQGSWLLGQQEIQFSRRISQPVLANTVQYGPVFLPGESPSLTGKPGRPWSTGLQSWTGLKLPCAYRSKMFFACGSSAPVRAEREDSTASWLVGTLGAPSVQGQGLPLLQELWPC